MKRKAFLRMAAGLLPVPLFPSLFRRPKATPVEFSLNSYVTPEEAEAYGEGRVNLMLDSVKPILVKREAYLPPGGTLVDVGEETLRAAAKALADKIDADLLAKYRKHYGGSGAGQHQRYGVLTGG